MLADVRSHVATMDTDLADLICYVRSLLVISEPQ